MSLFADVRAWLPANRSRRVRSQLGSLATSTTNDPSRLNVIVTSVRSDSCAETTATRPNANNVSNPDGRDRNATATMLLHPFANFVRRILR